jgi:hypothetical protein
MWSAFTLSALGSLYLLVTGYGMSSVGLSEPIVGLTLTIMELITLLTAPLLIVLVSTIYSTEKPEHKVYCNISLCFTVVATGITSAVHFVSLTAMKQTGAQMIIWPSTLYALELLAWDVFLGLALCFLSAAYVGRGLKRYIRSGLIIAGVLCLTGILGPASGDMRFQFIAVVGYGLIMPVIWLMIAIDFQNLLGQRPAKAS